MRFGQGAEQARGCWREGERTGLKTRHYNEGVGLEENAIRENGAPRQTGVASPATMRARVLSEKSWAARARESHHYDGQGAGLKPGATKREEKAPAGMLALQVERGMTGLPLVKGHSERSAWITSTRAARAAGSIDATTAAASSTNAERTTGKAPGIFTSGK